MTAPGTLLAWRMDPRQREARVVRPDRSVTVIDANGALEGEDAGADGAADRVQSCAN